MNIYIIYDSFFGNTEKISQILTNHLSENHSVKMFKAGEIEKRDLKDVDLLIIGSPTRGFEPTKPVVSFIKTFNKDELKSIKIAIFDTRLNIKLVNNKLLTFLVKHRGYACTTMERLLLKKDAQILGEPKGFIVSGSEGPLVNGEEERVRLWANSLMIKEVNFPVLNTKRLQLVELSDSYIDNLYEIFSDSRVTQFMDIYPMKSLEETEKEFVQWPENIYKDKTGIRWGILYENRIIGTCGFHNVSLEGDKKVAEIGYDLMVKYWGQGFISETIPAALEYAFSTLLIDEVRAFIFPENMRSKNSISKLGFTYGKTAKLEKPCKDVFYEEEIYFYRKDQ